MKIQSLGIAMLLLCAVSAQAKNLTKIFVVAPEGGDFKTVSEAIAAVPDNNNERVVIHIKPGTYKEKLTLPNTKGPVTFLGDDAKTTILTYDDHAKTLGADGKEIGTSRSASILIQSPEFRAENITFENSAGPVGQAVAVNVWSDLAVFRKCRFLGWQDTLLTNRNRQYFEDCFIIGSTDFIFGASTAWFERCHLHARTDSFLTAASTPQEKEFGYVFSNCVITGEAGVKNYLGRPWRPYASVAFLNTKMDDVIRPEGWHNWGKAENEKTARYAEYGSVIPDGKAVDVSKRVAWSKQLSEAEARAITFEKVFGGWNPNRNPQAQ